MKDRCSSKLKWAIAILASVVALGLTSVFISSRSGHTIKFEVIDYVTGKPISSPRVRVSRIWTRLPVDKLGISDRVTRTLNPTSSIVTVRDLKPVDQSFRIVVQARGYAELSFSSR
jgi:hypothetical protein